ncbi:protein KRBA1 [Heteronotia binoei]|uniref:protein KRBA1 n=1 Tax=Heteronotia binoei TaxID=13085 RepID=UPI00292F24A9|nr:protein KRBA1 [Heteronotia binoei]
MCSQPASPAISSSISSSPDRRPRWTPEPGKWARKEEGLSQNGPPLQGLERCLRELPPTVRSQPPSPALSSSSDGLHRWTPEAGKWPRKEEGTNPPGVPPLQSLENCLKEIPMSGNSLPNCFTATSFFCTQKLRRADAESRQRWAGGGPKDNLPRSPTIVSGCVEGSAESSPLDRLMSCLKEVPIRRPSYLNTPSLSSTSSSCSESERDQQSPESSGAWWDSSQALAGSIVIRSPHDSPKDRAAGPPRGSDTPLPDSLGGTSGREAEQNRVEGQRPQPLPEGEEPHLCTSWPDPAWSASARWGRNLGKAQAEPHSPG